MRTSSASSLASEASDLAPETWWRSRVVSHRHRVDRMNLIAGRGQRLHPRPAVGLDADHRPFFGSASTCFEPEGTRRQPQWISAHPTRHPICGHMPRTSRHWIARQSSRRGLRLLRLAMRPIATSEVELTDARSGELGWLEVRQSMQVSTIVSANPRGLVNMTSWLPGIWRNRCSPSRLVMRGCQPHSSSRGKTMSSVGRM